MHVNAVPLAGHHRIRRAYHFVKDSLECGEIEFTPDGITLIPTSAMEPENEQKIPPIPS